MKRLIVCCDGTWNDLTLAEPTNVVKFFEHIRPFCNEGIEQIAYYDEGVGTGGSSVITKKIDRILGAAFGLGLATNVQQAYRFLATNYTPGDEIYLVGFSRGAYTVRSVAGLMNFAGLLGRHQIRHINDAHEQYREHKSAHGQPAKDFREKYQTQSPPIKALICWDTVGALGIPNKIDQLKLDTVINEKFDFVDNTLSDKVDTAFHAISIHERREEFQQTSMHKNPANPNQQIHQMWFTGDHTAIGGGSRHKRLLSNIPLQWIMSQVKQFTPLALNHPEKDTLRVNPNVYFQQVMLPIYGKHSRVIGASDSIHPTALESYLSLKDLLPISTETEAVFKQALNQNEQLAQTNLSENCWSAMNINETKELIIPAANYKQNPTYIRVQKGQRYQIQVDEDAAWQDTDTLFNADGLPKTPKQERKLSWLQTLIYRLPFLRTIKHEDWLKLSFSYDARVTSPFGVGTRGEFTATQDGHLHAFPNDAFGFYRNNKGWLPVKITRLA